MAPSSPAATFPEAGPSAVTDGTEKMSPSETGPWGQRKRWQSTAVSTDVVVIMGVAGSGKTTVGSALATALGWPFVDADDLHAPASIAKMARGEPLDDADRWPWLDRLRARIDEALAATENAGPGRKGRPGSAGRQGLVLACSALKASYRARLAGADAGGRVRFVHLAGSPELFQARLAGRAGHFMKPAMLASQLATLEVPVNALTVDAALPVTAQVAAIRAALAL